ncbi:hypothetical protein [Streptosporangium sp. NPDC020145]|uniref:hypothetical protein n=1 Tax=Streptosporangium sp. NPDC020145 TaxID=3154694 RepID=UPI0034321FE3
MPNLTDLAEGIPPLVLWGVPGALAVVIVLYGLWHLKRGLTRRPLEDILTVVAAGVATGVSAQGMWRFSGDVLGFDGPLQLLLFAFIEVAMMTSAVRARRNMRESAERAKTDPLVTPSAGADGVAVWVLTGLSASLSSMDARSLAEAVFRLAAPLVAAWLWERGMAVERRRISGFAGINWRLTPERVLVRVGLAEARDRTASEVDAHRRLTRVALAAKRARALRETGASDRKVRGALAKLDKALDRAVEHTGLARDHLMQTALLDQITTLYGGASLLELPDAAPWKTLDHPAITNQARHSEALELAAALERNTAARLHGSPRPVATGDQSATTVATGRGLDGDHLDERDQTLPPSPEGRSWLASLTPWSRPVAPELRDRDPEPAPVAEAVAEEGVVATGRDGGRDRKKPSEQDRKRAVRFYLARAKKLNPPSKRTLAEWTGFSETWALDRIKEGRQIMIDEGWTFDEDGTPTPPDDDARPVATTPSLATVNGSGPAGGE